MNVCMNGNFKWFVMVCSWISLIKININCSTSHEASVHCYNIKDGSKDL